MSSPQNEEWRFCLFLRVQGRLPEKDRGLRRIVALDHPGALGVLTVSRSDEEQEAASAFNRGCCRKDGSSVTNRRRRRFQRIQKGQRMKRRMGMASLLQRSRLGSTQHAPAHGPSPALRSPLPLLFAAPSEFVGSLLLRLLSLKASYRTGPYVVLLRGTVTSGKLRGWLKASGPLERKMRKGVGLPFCIVNAIGC